MATHDQRPRNQRPRNRGGKSRLADRAIAARQDQHVSALHEALQPEAESLAREPGLDRREVVDRIRAQATTLARERVQGDVAGVVEATLDELFGLGPLEPLLRDPAVQRLRIVDAEVWADGQRLARGFRDVTHARATIDRILAAVGQDLARAPEGVEAKMVDGSVVRARLDGAVLRVDIARRRGFDAP